MPDRFRQFTEAEIIELREGLDMQWVVNRATPRSNDDVDRLLDEIKHEQIQQAHAAARQRSPA